MPYAALNLKEKLSQVHTPWTPKIIAQLNDYHVKVARIEGAFVWHSHPETDEAFLVVEGTMKILFRDGQVSLRAGELFVVPRGVEHCPVADAPCHILLIEPAGTVNTGDAGGTRTAPADTWI